MESVPNQIAGQSRSSASPSHASRNSGNHSSTNGNISVEQFRKLAEFRFQLRKFLQFSHAVAEHCGLRHQQYQLLQCVQGIPSELDPTIANVAARMLLKHNSAVELVDRTIEQGLLRRCPDPTDHRRILLRVSHQGERVLASLADYHMQELEQAGPELIRSLRRVLNIKPASGKQGTSEQ
jgi:DNA-binding MarR family transcriptional regulator